MTDQSTENHETPIPPQEPKKSGFVAFDERTGQVLVEAARTGLYAAAGLADAMAGAVKHSYDQYQEEAKQRRAKRAAQAEEVKNFISQAPNKATNLPEQAKEWPDQMRVRAEAFLEEARTAIVDLAERGRTAVERVRPDGRGGATREHDADLSKATAEGFGVNADTTEPQEHVAGGKGDEAPGEGFGVHPADVENAGLGGEFPADNLGETAPAPDPEPLSEPATEPVEAETGFSEEQH
ncbi:hypothetical protein [Enemella sp. A6]|uniref:hypothetical protein n=1 Tax=Enemella sp. A6 TaxID=3440152 RepID=UPI003EBAC9D4